MGELGNGLQDEGVLGEQAWKTKPEFPRTKHPLFQKLYAVSEGLENAQNVVGEIEQVTGNLRSVAESGNQIKANLTAIETEVSNQNAAAAAGREAEIAAIVLPSFQDLDFR